MLIIDDQGQEVLSVMEVFLEEEVLGVVLGGQEGHCSVKGVE